MWVLLDSFSQTPILLLGRKEQKGGHLEGGNRKASMVRKRSDKSHIFKIRKYPCKISWLYWRQKAAEQAAKKPPILISDELLAAMKKMSPQEAKNALIKPEERQFRGPQQLGNNKQ